MMKIGAMSLNVRNTTATAFAQIVYDLGYDMIELHSSAFESTDIDYLRTVKKDLMKKGLPLGYIGISNDFGCPVEEHPEQIALIKKWIDVADFMSCPLVRIFAAYLREEHEDEEQLWPPMIAGFKEVAAYGYEKGSSSVYRITITTMSPVPARIYFARFVKRITRTSHTSSIPDSTRVHPARVVTGGRLTRITTATIASHKQPLMPCTLAQSFIR